MPHILILEFLGHASMLFLCGDFLLGFAVCALPFFDNSTKDEWVSLVVFQLVSLPSNQYWQRGGR